jgi:hypothetical protein
VNAFYSAFRDNFSDAWEDGKMRFIVLEAIGLNGFSKFGGSLANRWLENQNVDPYDHFDHYLKMLKKSGVQGLRREFPAMYGAVGAEAVFSRCMAAIYEATGIDLENI